MKFSGLEHLKRLPKTDVLFVSNHQTYFADVTAINHGFHLSSRNRKNPISDPFYLFPPFVRSYYVAAKETMKKGGLLPFLFSYAGAILVSRTWREKGKEISRPFDPKDQNKILKALTQGWVVTFPQGTTKPFAPPRKGTAKIIQTVDPLVVPVSIDGFRKGFEKKGLWVKKAGQTLKIEFKEPRKYTGRDTDDILEDIMRSIGQYTSATNLVSS